MQDSRSKHSPLGVFKVTIVDNTGRWLPIACGKGIGQPEVVKVAQSQHSGFCPLISANNLLIRYFSVIIRLLKYLLHSNLLLLCGSLGQHYNYILESFQQLNFNYLFLIKNYSFFEFLCNKTLNNLN